MTESASSPTPRLDPRKIASVRRRLGFVALLWSISAVFGTMGVLQGLAAGWGRLLFVGVAWVLALFFTYAWWQLRKGN